MKLSQFTTTVGRVNMTSQLAELFLFFVPTSGLRGRAEAFLGKAAKDLARFTDSPVRLLGSVQVVPSLSDRAPEIGGNTAMATYNIADGTILKAFAKVKSPGMAGLIESEIVFMRARSTAALRHLIVSCPRSNRVAVENFAVTGRFDIITADEAVAFAGDAINPLSLAIARRKPSGVIKMEILAPETAPAAKDVIIETSSGEKKVMKVERKLRRLS